MIKMIKKLLVIMSLFIGTLVSAQTDTIYKSMHVLILKEFDNTYYAHLDTKVSDNHIIVVNGVNGIEDSWKVPYRRYQIYFITAKIYNGDITACIVGERLTKFIKNSK